MRLDSRHFSLSPAVLQLGYAYLSALGARAIAQPYLESLSDRVEESSSMTVLDGTEIVYVARVPTKRIFSLALGIGSRLPAFATSTGRVLMSDLSEVEVDDILQNSELVSRTVHTIVEPDQIRKELDKARDQGWYLLDEEVELGIVAVAAPVRDESGRVVAAINVTTTVARTSKMQLIDEILPELLTTADEISVALKSR